MSESTSFKVPDDIRQLVSDLHEKKVKKDLENLKKESEENQVHLNLIRKRVEAGLPYAKTIFAWAAQFIKSDIGQKLFSIGDSYIGKGFFFFDTHLEGISWRGLGLSPNGVWWHSSGCGARPHLVKTPRELAEALDPETLKVACHEIETGKVWETIKRRMENNRYLRY